MKILFLSFYYSPDLCAGSFRSTALVKELSKYDVNIDVITTKPNRYSSYSAKALEYESDNNVNIHRVSLPNHNSGMLDQIKAFTSYYFYVRKHIKDNDYDLVFSTSSRLFTAFLGSRVSRKKKIPLYLDIRDIFVDTIKDVLPKTVAKYTKPLFSLIENYSFRQASHINLVSEGFRGYFESRYQKSCFTWFTNGIDDAFLKGGVMSLEPELKNSPLKIVYAGNIGEGQGLHNIVPNLAKKLEGRASFRIIGSGGRLTQLEESVSSAPNVDILNPVNRNDLLVEYQQADVLFLHLNDYPAFEKVLPSKIFEYAAMGKPILAGVNGYSAQFLKQNVANSAVFHPSNEEQAYQALASLELATIDRVDFKNKFSRQSIMSEMASNIYSYVARDKK